MKSPLLCLLLLFAASGLGQGAVLITPFTFPDGLVTPRSPLDSPFQRRGLDLNQDGTEDFRFIAEGPFFGVTFEMTITNRITGYGYGEGSLDLGGFATSMPPLSIIGAELPAGAEWWNDFYGALIISGNEGVSQPPGMLFGLHYVGLEFKAGALTHYGYVKFQGRSSAVDILETAWETEPGRSIIIPIPEPTTGSCLIALAAIAFLRRPCRRGPESR